MKVVIIGSGNVAEALVVALTEAKVEVVQVYARNAERGRAVAALAGAAGTIPYEILARLGPRVERKYKNEDLGHYCAE